MNSELNSKQLTEIRERKLNFSNFEDRKIILKLVEKALDLEIRKVGGEKLHGIYLLEKPVNLYGCEKAKLYLGFNINVKGSEENGIQVEVQPQALIRESVLDYVRWRRSRGASAKSIKNALLKLRPNVILAPNGCRGLIKEVLFQKAGEFEVPILRQTLPEFWEETYGIKVDPEEKPLIIVKPFDLPVNTALTYLPSCVFFDEQAIGVRLNVLNFIKYKRKNLKQKVFNTILQALQNLQIGEQKLKLLKTSDNNTNIQLWILNEIREKLLGRELKATGSIVKVNDTLYFLPKLLREFSNGGKAEKRISAFQ